MRMKLAKYNNYASNPNVNVHHMFVGCHKNIEFPIDNDDPEEIDMARAEAIAKHYNNV